MVDSKPIGAATLNTNAPLPSISNSVTPTLDPVTSTPTCITSITTSTPPILIFNNLPTPTTPTTTSNPTLITPDTSTTSIPTSLPYKTDYKKKKFIPKTPELPKPKIVHMPSVSFL